MKYVYHFHTMRQQSGGPIVHTDGVITRETPIVTGDDYNGVKTAIAEDQPGEDGRKWTLCSLSLLSTVEDNE